MQMQMIRKLAITGSLLVALAPAVALGEDKPAFSGFLGDYSGFQESDRVKGAWIYTKAGMSITDLGKYNKVILDPVVVYGGSDDVFKDIDQAQLQQAADDFHATLASTLGSDYPVVTEPGPDVLQVRTALTGSVPKDPEHSALQLHPGRAGVQGRQGRGRCRDGQEGNPGRCDRGNGVHGFRQQRAPDGRR